MTEDSKYANGWVQSLEGVYVKLPVSTTELQRSFIKMSLKTMPFLRKKICQETNSHGNLLLGYVYQFRDKRPSGNINSIFVVLQYSIESFPLLAAISPRMVGSVIAALHQNQSLRLYLHIQQLQQRISTGQPGSSCNILPYQVYGVRIKTQLQFLQSRLHAMEVKLYSYFILVLTADHILSIPFSIREHFYYSFIIRFNSITSYSQ